MEVSETGNASHSRWWTWSVSRLYSTATCRNTRLSFPHKTCDLHVALSGCVFSLPAHRHTRNARSRSVPPFRCPACPLSQPRTLELEPSNSPRPLEPNNSRVHSGLFARSLARFLALTLSAASYSPISILRCSSLRAAHPSSAPHIARGSPDS
eukprot:1679434-Rhodomonas_salina.2